MGSQQENWFYRNLIESKERGAVWRIIGNQIVFSRINITSWFGTFENPYNGDQWDGYMVSSLAELTSLSNVGQANRNRTFQTLYDYDISNNIVLSGDSHANWVSDLVWQDYEEYNPVTGAGAVGVEFAGTAVSSSGFGGTLLTANNQSDSLIRDNSELQWNEGKPPSVILPRTDTDSAEGYYRGYFELQISAEKIDAYYYGCPTVATRNPYEISLANFTVIAGANKLQRPVAGGSVESGFLQGGEVDMTNLTLNTETGEYLFTSFNQMFISYPDDE